MTLHEFKLLSESEQLSAICLSVSLLERTDKLFDYELYQLDGFYIELVYYGGTTVIKEMKLFSNPTLLDPYFGQIDISELSF